MKDSIIKALAGTVIILLVFLFIAEPFLIGKPRVRRSENYTASDWASTWLTIAIFLPICGRVLGWW